MSETNNNPIQTRQASPLCCVEGCGQMTRFRKIFCDHHYIQDLELKLEWAKDKIYDLEKQTITELEEILKLAIYSLEKIVDRYFDIPPEKRFQKRAIESQESLTARQALKIINEWRSLLDLDGNR